MRIERLPPLERRREGKARQGKARQGKARQGKAGQEQCHGKPRQSKASLAVPYLALAGRSLLSIERIKRLLSSREKERGQVNANRETPPSREKDRGQGKASQGQAGQGKASQGRPGALPRQSKA